MEISLTLLDVLENKQPKATSPWLKEVSWTGNEGESFYYVLPLEAFVCFVTLQQTPYKNGLNREKGFLS